MGLSIGSYAGESSAGFQIGPTFDVAFGKGLDAGTEFLINTQTGTPVGWANYFKYLIDVPQSDITPYADGGFNLMFVTGGPYFGIQFGGGAYFPVAKGISIPADFQFGPIFATGSTAFYVAFTTGIRYTFPK